MIPITRPVFDQKERDAVAAVLESGWIVQGPKVKEFQEGIARYTGCQHALAVTSCTTALHLSLVALGIGQGDEVILPAFTFVATANVVEYVGATPVFVDIDLKTFNIDPSLVEQAVTPRTRAMIPVDLFGLCADMEPLLKIASRHHLKVIEDAACAIGGWHHGSHAGSMGDAGCLSFHPRKSITTGEGGMLLTNDDRIAWETERLRDHGATLSDRARHEQGLPLLPEYPVVGYNYRMTDIQAAIGVEQLKKFPMILERKRHLAKMYNEALTRLPWLIPQATPPGYLHGYQAYVCLFSPEPPTLANAARLHRQRNELMRKLQGKEIATRQGTHAPVLLEYYARKYGLKPEQFPHAYLADLLTLALPLYGQMTDDEQLMVCESLEEAFDDIFQQR